MISRLGHSESTRTSRWHQGTGNCSCKALWTLQALKRSMCVLATRAKVMKDPMVIGKDHNAAVVSYS